MRAFRFALAVALFGLLSAGSASAITLVPECTGGCFGVDIELNVTLTSVQLTMDFEDYVGTPSFPPGHPDLEAIAFKLYTNDDVEWELDSAYLDLADFDGGFDTLTNGGLNDSGCKGTGDGWDCFAGSLDILDEENLKPELTLNYIISNADALRGAGESSFQAKFGPDNGWLISETMIPEPTGAALFLVGGVVVSSSIRRRRA